MLIESRPGGDPELAAMVIAQQRELFAAEGRTDALVYPVHDDVRFLVGVLDARAVACGAVQSLDDATAEFKRMYVVPGYRRRGLARRLLDALEDFAWAAGYREVRLETGTYLHAALALYRAAGYTTIPTYGEYVGNPHSVCFAKPRPSSLVDQTVGVGSEPAGRYPTP